jgi:hypothetical protein
VIARPLTCRLTTLLRSRGSPGLRSEFDRRLTALNDPELKRLIVDFVRDMADVMDQSVNDAERKVELLDRAGVGVAASVTVAGIGTTVAAVASGAATGSLLGPVGLLVGGLVGLVASAWGRDRLKRSANVSKSWSAKFRRLAGKE